jgi:catechol 2,3-dioxygenase-like lactoylglutathione lyase family enzyme
VNTVQAGFNVLALLGLEPLSASTPRRVGRMQGRIALITILTDDVPRLVAFYRDVLGFVAENPSDAMTEFVSEGVRFAVCNRAELINATHHPSFSEPAKGQAFELAFPLPTPDDVDRAYAEITANGAAPIQSPATMPWGQRTAFFADPDGNIHELFAD